MVSHTVLHFLSRDWRAEAVFRKPASPGMLCASEVRSWLQDSGSPRLARELPVFLAGRELGASREKGKLAVGDPQSPADNQKTPKCPVVRLHFALTGEPLKVWGAGGYRPILFRLLCPGEWTVKWTGGLGAS